MKTCSSHNIRMFKLRQFPQHQNLIYFLNKFKLWLLAPLASGFVDTCYTLHAKKTVHTSDPPHFKSGFGIAGIRPHLRRWSNVSVNFFEFLPIEFAVSSKPLSRGNHPKASYPRTRQCDLGGVEPRPCDRNLGNNVTFSYLVTQSTKSPSRDNYRKAFYLKDAITWPAWCGFDRDHANRVVVKITPSPSWPRCQLSDLIVSYWIDLTRHATKILLRGREAWTQKLKFLSKNVKVAYWANWCNKRITDGGCGQASSHRVIIVIFRKTSHFTAIWITFCTFCRVIWH